jgi:hypothetical protein
LEQAHSTYDALTTFFFLEWECIADLPLEIFELIFSHLIGTPDPWDVAMCRDSVKKRWMAQLRLVCQTWPEQRIFVFSFLPGLDFLVSGEVPALHDPLNQACLHAMVRKPRKGD